MAQIRIYLFSRIQSWGKAKGRVWREVAGKKRNKLNKRAGPPSSVSLSSLVQPAHVWNATSRKKNDYILLGSSDQLLRPVIHSRDYLLNKYRHQPQEMSCMDTSGSERTLKPPGHLTSTDF